MPWINDTTPALTGTNYSDPNGDPQVAAQFRIRPSTGTYGGAGSFDSGVLPGAVVAWTTPTLQDGVLYVWQVRYSDGVFSAFSAETSFGVDIVDPTRATGVNVSAPVTDGRFTLSWTRGTDDKTGLRHDIRYSPNGGGNWVVFGTWGDVDNASLIFGPGTYLFTVVTADEAGNESAWATATSITINPNASVPVPTNVTATPNPSPGNIAIVWDASAVNGYLPSRATGGGSTFFQRTAVASAGTSDNFSTNNLVRFRVCAHLADKVSDWSALTPFVIVDTDNPAPPPAVSPTPNPATGGNTQVTWTAATDTGGSGVARYTVQRAPSGSSSWTLVADVPNGSPLEVMDAPGDGRWVYRVRTTDAAGNTSTYRVSAEVLFDGSAPSFLGPPSAFPNPSQGPVDLAWQANDAESGVASYTLARSEDDGANWSDVASGPGVSALDQPPQGRHLYRVRSQNQAGLVAETGSSEPVWIDWTPPSPPANPIVFRHSSGELRIAWEPSDDGSGIGVRGYVVERSTDHVSWAALAEAGTTVTDDPEGGTEFDYRVSAIDFAANRSEAVLTTTQNGPHSLRIGFACSSTAGVPSPLLLAAALGLFAARRQRA